MTEASQAGLRQALRIWRSRQAADGFLVAGVLATASVTLIYFLFEPGKASATVLFVALAALILSSTRLIQSASNVARLRSRIRFQVALAESLAADTSQSSVGQLN